MSHFLCPFFRYFSPPCSYRLKFFKTKSYFHENTIFFNSSRHLFHLAIAAGPQVVVWILSIWPTLLSLFFYPCWCRKSKQKLKWRIASTSPKTKNLYCFLVSSILMISVKMKPFKCFDVKTIFRYAAGAFKVFEWRHQKIECLEPRMSGSKY